MTKISRKEFYVFFLPLLGFWALLIAIYLGKDFEESFKLVPTFFYFVSSGLTVFNVKNLLTGAEYDPIVKNAKTRGLLICLLISTLSILVEFSFEEKNLIPTFFIIFSTIASFFLTGLFDYSNEQLEEKFLERSSERNFSIESRDLWEVYLDQIESKFENSIKIQNEIERIRKILPYSTFFRSKKSKIIMKQVQEINNEDNLVSILKKYVR
tara:strand:- start:1327 stop:1959 length:633 start_codon:yes stop_codon:yes gene_type:complete